MTDSRRQRVGVIRHIYRYPVKSMRGEALERARIAWRGLSGDRRFAFVQSENRTGFPWLTGREYPAMVRYVPSFIEPDAPHKSKVLVRTPDSLEMPLESPDLIAHITDGRPQGISLMRFDFIHAVDLADVSFITTTTLRSLSALVNTPVAARRLRPNLVIESFESGDGYPEGAWEGGTLVIGEREDTARLRVACADPRCKMVDIDPEAGIPTPGLLEAIVRRCGGNAGMYAAIERPGIVAVGDPVTLITA